MNAFFFLTGLKTTVLHFLSFDDVSKCDLIVYFIRLKAVNSIFLIPNTHTHTVCIVTHARRLPIAPYLSGVASDSFSVGAGFTTLKCPACVCKFL